MDGRKLGAATTLVLAMSLCPSAAEADTPGCASHKEYRNLHTLMSPLSVKNLLDTHGWFIGDTEVVFKRGYRTCWAPGEKKVVVGYVLSTSLSVWKDVRPV